MASNKPQRRDTTRPGHGDGPRFSTVKLIFALHATDVDDALRSPELHHRLRAAGAHRLQLNLDDEPVAAAQLRLSTGTTITAVVSVWSDGEPGALVDVARELDPTADGWLVEERCPLPPPDVPDGERTDGLANVAFLRRPDGMTPGDWLAYWLDAHTAVAIETQGTFGYVQNPVLEPVTPDAAPVAGIVEELFPMTALGDLHAFYGSGGDDAELQRRLGRLLESVGRFGADRDLDLVPTSRYVFTLSE
jgi:hypothetical protein